MAAFHAAVRDLPQYPRVLAAYRSVSINAAETTAIPLAVLDDLDDYLTEILAPHFIPDRLIDDLDDAIRTTRALDRHHELERLLHLSAMRTIIERLRFDALEGAVERHRDVLARYLHAEGLDDRSTVTLHAAQSEFLATLAHAETYGVDPIELLASSGPGRIGRLGERAAHQRIMYERLATAVSGRSTDDMRFVGR